MKEAGIVEAIAREMQIGALALGSDRRVLYANPFLLRSFPLKDEAKGRLLEDLIGDKRLLEAVNIFFEEGRKPEENIEIAEGKKAFSVRLVALPDECEASLMLFIRDVTEEKRVEAIKKDFVANVSHELRTPLASIKGYSETLLDGGVEEADTAKDFLRIIDKHATRMSRLIDDLLVLSRLESQQLPVEIDSLDLPGIAVPIIDGFKKQASDKGIGLSTEIEDGLRLVRADRDRIEQVIVNLLDNAIKYTPSGGDVKVKIYSYGNEARVDISDTGIGIPSADIPRIFERFYRVDKARSRELGGTGLGLAIVKHIMSGLNGRVWVESEPGRGSCFSFTLMVAR